LALLAVVVLALAAGCRSQGDLSNEKSPSLAKAPDKMKEEKVSSKPSMPKLRLVPVGSEDSIKKVGEGDTTK
jgi:hypothetical protein